MGTKTKKYYTDLRQEACLIEYREVNRQSEEELDQFLDDLEIDGVHYHSERLKGMPIDDKREALRNWHRIYIYDETDEEIERLYAESVKDQKLLRKVRKAAHNGRLNLEKGSRDWNGLHLNITPLVWARNLEDGYDIDVHKYRPNGRHTEHIGTVKIRD